MSASDQLRNLHAQRDYVAALTALPLIADAIAAAEAESRIHYNAPHSECPGCRLWTALAVLDDALKGTQI